MSTKKDVKIVSEGKVKKKSGTKITDTDFNKIAEFVSKELDRRKENPSRKAAEANWVETDRQLRMEPDIAFKTLPDGSKDLDKYWMPEMELPLQSIAYEVLTGSVQKKRFPDSGINFTASVETTDDYLVAAEQDVRITGDLNDTPSKITQDNADKLVQGFMSHLMRQYEFENYYNVVDGEAIKYGVGVARAVMVKKSTQMQTAKGIVKTDQEIPVFVPRSIKNTYLDTNKHSVLNSGFMLNGSVIEHNVLSLSDATIAARAGSTDPEKSNGGWMPRMLEGIAGTGDQNDDIEVMEFEGDLIMSLTAKKNLVAPNVMITVLRGQVSKDNENKASRVIRFRFSKLPRSSYLSHYYNPEHVDDPYSPGVLGKGMHVQKAATEALNRLMQATAYNAEPATVYNSEDPDMVATSGPRLHPGAKIGAVSGIDVLDIGDPSGLFAVYSGFLQQYSDVTGITPSRLGAQTVSHTTRFAKQAELVQGEERTLDYVTSTFKGGNVQWLDLCYKMGREALKGRISIYIEEYGGFVEFSKKSLPENVVFEVFGAGAVLEKNEEAERERAARNEAIQIELIRVQAGLPPRLDIDALQDAALREGVKDIDVFIKPPPPQGVPGGASDQSAVPGAAGDVTNTIPGVVQALEQPF